ncbi:hypothetical protein IG631_16117 [Alternaria alternata]|nr:hypothetical protein IG631_16117 [Alternaria alternata]
MITLNPLNSSVHSFLVERVTGLLRACRLVRGMQECKCQPTSYWPAAHVRYSNASGGGEESACRHLTYLGYPTDATSYDLVCCVPSSNRRSLCGMMYLEYAQGVSVKKCTSADAPAGKVSMPRSFLDIHKKPHTRQPFETSDAVIFGRRRRGNFRVWCHGASLCSSAFTAANHGTWEILGRSWTSTMPARRLSIILCVIS